MHSQKDHLWTFPASAIQLLAGGSSAATAPLELLSVPTDTWRAFLTEVPVGAKALSGIIDLWANCCKETVLYSRIQRDIVAMTSGADADAMWIAVVDACGRLPAGHEKTVEAASLVRLAAQHDGYRQALVDTCDRYGISPLILRELLLNPPAEQERLLNFTSKLLPGKRFADELRALLRVAR